MAYSTKVDMFGIHITRFLSLLKHTEQIVPVAQENDHPSVALVKTTCAIYRTAMREELAAKYPLRDDSTSISFVRQGWAKQEAQPAQATLHFTNALLECDCDVLARKFVTLEGQIIWINKALLDVFDINLAELLFESIPHAFSNKPYPLEECPVRISRSAGHTVAYVMPMTGVRERVY